MRKILKSFIILFFLVVFNMQYVGAASDPLKYQIEKGAAHLLCEYGNSKVKIYYNYLPKDAAFEDIGNKDGQWYIYYDKNKKGQMELVQNKSFGTFGAAFKSDIVNLEKDKTSFPASYEKTFHCPKFVNIEYDGPWHRVCFSDTTEGYCEDYNTIFEEKYELSKSSNSIFNQINKYAEETVYETLKPEDIANKSTQAVVKEKTTAYLNNTILKTSSADYYIPEFYQKYVDSLEDHLNPKNTKAYDNFMKKVKDWQKKNTTQIEDLRKRAAASTIPEEKKAMEDAAKRLEEQNKGVEENSQETYFAAEAQVNENITGNKDATCSGLLGPTTTKIVNNILKTVQLAGPILVAILTVLDFVKATMSGEADEMKKAASRLSKRLAFAILLFFVPLLCNTLLELAGITLPDTCIR